MLVKGLKSLKKKTLFYKERDEKKREEFKKELKKIAQEDHVYLDESGINECLKRHRGRAFRGEKVYSAVSGHRFARESLIAAKCQSKIFAPFCYTETCHPILFNTWLEKY
ncbi:transposase [Candidatus Protochlamydia sp. R18]|uniref:transposase n=1 Tax=Candidatus Protochlamydia sp. R18 TaxID=1353977 RepID=UPI000693B461|nr:transposase [Candidatus Protochlamydia sp. R18]